MATIDSLSNELLLQVFEYLYSPNHLQRTLCSCLRVSRRWHDLALPIVWKALHLDLNWQKLYEINRNIRKYPTVTHFPVTPLRLDKFCQSLELLEQKSLDPLQWCRYLSLGVDSVDVSNARTASTAQLMSILLRCNNLRRVQIYVKFSNRDDVMGFRLMWGLIVRHLSRQQLSVQLKFVVHTELSPYDYPFDSLRENLTNLDIDTRRPLADCIPRGELSQFAHLESLKIRPSNMDADDLYTSSENSLFWNEVGRLQLKHLDFVSGYPALTWNGHHSAVPPTSLRTLRIAFCENEDSAGNPMMFLRQLPNLETLSLRRFYDLDDDPHDEPTDEPTDYAEVYPPRACQLCHRGVLTTYHLTILYMGTECPSPAFKDIVFACPLLEDILFPPRFSNDDIVSAVSACKVLKKVEFSDSDRLSSHGLVFLCKAKTLREISLEVLQWDLIQPALEHWAMQLPLLTLLDCGLNDGNVKDFCEWSRHRSWKSISKGNFLSGYGKSLFCCLEKEAKDIVLPDKPRWNPENRTAMEHWIYSFVRYDGSTDTESLDMVAMRSDLMSDGDYYR